MKVRDAYHLLNTTSPSPFLLAELESCVRFLKHDENIINQAISMNKRLREHISKLPGVTVSEIDGI